jgi:hypothetical protein
MLQQWAHFDIQRRPPQKAFWFWKQNPGIVLVEKLISTMGKFSPIISGCSDAEKIVFGHAKTTVTWLTITPSTFNGTYNSWLGIFVMASILDTISHHPTFQKSVIVVANLFLCGMLFLSQGRSCHHQIK